MRLLVGSPAADTVHTQDNTMNWFKLAAVLALFGHALVTQAADGLVAVKSPYTASETMNRLESTVEDRGLNVFAPIDHAAGAAKVG